MPCGSKSFSIACTPMAVPNEVDYRASALQSRQEVSYILSLSPNAVRTSWPCKHKLQYFFTKCFSSPRTPTTSRLACRPRIAIRLKPRPILAKVGHKDDGKMPKWGLHTRKVVRSWVAEASLHCLRRVDDTKRVDGNGKFNVGTG